MSEDKKDKNKKIAEDKKRKSEEHAASENSSSRAVTSDENNTASPYVKYNGGKSAGGDNTAEEEDILSVIQKRRNSSRSESVTNESADATSDMSIADDLLDFDFSADASDGSESLSDTKAIEIRPSDTAPESINAKTIEIEPSDIAAETSLSAKTIEIESSEITEGSHDARTIEIEPSGIAAGSHDAKTIEIDSSDIGEAEPVADADSGKDEPADLSELEKELNERSDVKATSGKKVKRYGFKPYTRELQAEEIRALQEAAKNTELNAGATGKVKKMAKGTGQKKSGNNSGSAKTSKKDKNARTSTKGASSGASTKSKSQSGKKKSSSSSGKSGGPTKVKAKKASKPKKKWVGFFRAFIRTIIIFAVIGIIACAGYTANIISHAPVIHPRNIYDTLDVSTHIYDDKEKLVDEIYYSENRQIVSYEQLPENLKNAFIAVEDKTFWTHRGFNFKRIIGAILERFHGGRISGTSTITQQLARNVFLPEDKSVRSIKRKIIEMYYAYEIEQELSKEEIITAYLNTIYLGYGCYGVDTAAKTYFSSDVEDLTLEQCAALAALPQAPGTYALLVTEPNEDCVEYKNGVYINDTSKDRRNMILNMMLQQGLITAEEKEAATKPLEDFIDPGSTSSAASQSAFKDYVIETVKKDLMDEYGIEEDQAIKIIYTKGLNIYTTMDSQAQKVITKQFSKKSNFPSTTNGKGNVESAMVVCEVGTGEIKAMVGTRNATGQMLFNRATNPRQPGSSIKPLSVYAPALQRSLEYQKDGKTFKFKDTGYDRQGPNGWGDYITVSSKVVDEKMTVNGKTWPLNVTRSYSGYNTFRTAIQKSINTCSVKILAQIGIEYSMDTLKRFGITSAIDDSSKSTNDLNLAALGLGAMSYGISPLEMAAAYATFPNGGVVNSPICYTKVEDSSGRTLLEGKSEETKVLDPGVAWIMTDVLKSVVSKGIAGNAAVSGIEVGGKTGTTDDRFDIWFNGFTPSYSVALWIGTDDNVQMDSASDKAASLWSKVVSKMDRAKEGKYKKMPDNVFRAWNGEYYTNGTAPPEPPPEPDPEEEKEKEKAKDAKAGDKKGADTKTPAAKGDAAPAPKADKTEKTGN